MSEDIDKDRIIKFLIDDATYSIAMCKMFASGNDSDEEMNFLFDDISLILAHINNEIPRSILCQDDIFTAFDDERFKNLLRVNKEQFSFLANLISDDPEFTEPNSCNHFSLTLQLAIVLCRLGSYEENESNKILSIFGVKDTETIFKITLRIFNCFLRLKSKYIFWPNKEERLTLVAETCDELPHCIGYIDGTEIKLGFTPTVNTDQYFSQKYIYSMKAQIVCDKNLRIMQAVTGYPGSVDDAKMYSNCQLFLNIEKYFSLHQWIAADSEYSLSETVITPYRKNSKSMTYEKRKTFNFRLNYFRARIEKCIALLKDKFQSLKELRLKIDNKYSHKMCCQWILVCCILHNILLEKSAWPEYVKIDEDFPDAVNNTENYEEINRKGEIKRQALYSLIFE